MTRIPIHTHANIHQGGKIKGGSISGVDLVGSGSGGSGGGGGSSTTEVPTLILQLTNKSGGAIAAGDVVVIDTTNDDAFTTTTTGRAEVSVGIAQAAIASDAVGAVLVSGYAALVNVPSSMTRGHYLETHTVVKQATGSATRRAGSFGQFLIAGTTPTAWLWGQTDQTATGGSGAPTTSDYLVGTADAGLSNEIVVGTTPGGELGNTWASPTVDATHSGSAHTDFIAKAFFAAKGDLIGATANDTPSILSVGANDTILMAESAEATGLKWVASQTPSTQAFGDAAAEGTADTYARGDHKHGMPASSALVGLGYNTYPIGTSTVTAPTNDEALASSGGTLVIPFEIAATMHFTSVFLHSRATANLRTAEYRLYYYGGSTLDFVTGTDGTYSFTPTVASDRSSTPSGSPVTLSPGVYWLAIRNTSATQNFSVGYANVAATYFNQSTLAKIQTLGSALGSTLTQVGWTDGARLYAVALRPPANFGI